MEVISIERSTYEELLTSFNSFVTQMKAMAGRGTDKRQLFLSLCRLRRRNYSVLAKKGTCFFVLRSTFRNFAR